MKEVEELLMTSAVEYSPFSLISLISLITDTG